MGNLVHLDIYVEDEKLRLGRIEGEKGKKKKGRKKKDVLKLK